MKKSLKQFIFEKMKEEGYVSDKELAKFCGKEPNFYTASVYAKEWRNLESAKEYFDGKIDSHTTISKFGRKYVIKIDKDYRGIPKIYFEYLKEKGIKIICD